MEQWTPKIGLTQLNSEKECSETRIQLHLSKMVFYILSIANHVSRKARIESHILSGTKYEVDLLQVFLFLIPIILKHMVSL